MGGLLSYFQSDKQSNEVVSEPEPKNLDTLNDIDNYDFWETRNFRSATSTVVKQSARPSFDRIYAESFTLGIENKRPETTKPLFIGTGGTKKKIKGYMNLSPSEIRYSQDSIGTTFYEKGRHADVKIGQTLDDLLSGKIRITNIPMITVCSYKQHWFSMDNRRLWVLKNYERIKGFNKIKVKFTDDIDEEKLTTSNGGVRIIVRGDPGGEIWKLYR